MKKIKGWWIGMFAAITLGACSSSTVHQDKGASAVIPDVGKTVVVDVRTEEEWNNEGHAPCAVNYPLDGLGAKIDSLKQYDKVVVVCRSGHRAGMAKDLLNEKGITNVENKGSWRNIECK